VSALLIALAGHLWPYLIAAVAGLGFLWSAYAKGKAAERAKQIEAEAKARDISDQVQNDVGALPADAARKELGQWSPKP
jgi:hypothetical protein